jgi:NAD(P)-dependent dehydrogenase (short-subunit alcohol dehydrogenase family)
MTTHDWTPDHMPDLTGTRALVTGANSGIGFHTALELARRGAEVAMACRNEGSAAEAKRRIDEEVGADRTSVVPLDLSSSASVHACADTWDGALDLLVNNAGVMTPPRYRETADGSELQFGTNHLGHFALTGLLLPNLLKAATPRVVTVSSLAHAYGRNDVLLGNQGGRYNPQRAYGNSKLANVLFSDELQRRASAHGTSLTAAAAHPGVSHTNLATSPQGLGAIPGVRRLAPVFLSLFVQSAAAGARPVLYAATAAQPGSYTGPQRFFGQRGPIGPASRQRLAYDEELAARLWEVSEEQTGITYDWP